MTFAIHKGNKQVYEVVKTTGVFKKRCVVRLVNFKDAYHEVDASELDFNIPKVIVDSLSKGHRVI